MKIYIKTGSGDNPLTEVVDALIFTRNEAMKRGQKELITSKQVSKWTIVIPYRQGVRRGVIFMADCPEAGVFFEPIIIKAYESNMINGAKAIITMTCETYRKWEEDYGGDS